MVVITSLLGAVALAGTGQFLLKSLFGAQFATGYLPLILLLPGAVGMSCARMCQTWLLIYGHGRAVQHLNAWTAGAAALLWVITIPRYGLYAAAVVSSVVYGTLGISTAAMLRRATIEED
jgi:O-antigen/teichoic acid export membrane protein